MSDQNGCLNLGSENPACFPCRWRMVLEWVKGTQTVLVKEAKTRHPGHHGETDQVGWRRQTVCEPAAAWCEQGAPSGREQIALAARFVRQQTAQAWQQIRQAWFPSASRSQIALAWILDGQGHFAKFRDDGRGLSFPFEAATGPRTGPDGHFLFCRDLLSV